MLAVYVMLAACVPIDETFDYHYAALQSGYSAIGTHESLMVESALYRTLAELQFSLPKN